MATTILAPQADAGPTGSAQARARAAKILARDIPFLVGLPYEELNEEPLVLSKYSAASRLDAGEERVLFRQLNLARYLAAGLRQQLSREAPDPQQLDDIERLVARADQIRNLLAIVFEKLVVSIAWKFANARTTLEELVSEGQVVLVNAIPKFDPERGFRFSTYATHAVSRRLLRYLRKRQRDDAVMHSLPTDHSLADDGHWSYAYEQSVTSTLEQIERLLSQLPPRDRYVIRSRYGWGREFDPRTLQEIAAELGVSRERVRQLEARSLKRLRQLAHGVDFG